MGNGRPARVAVLLATILLGIAGVAHAVTYIVWSTRAPMPTYRDAFGMALAPSGKVYVVGGVYQGVSPAVEEYDPLTNSWAARAPLPTPRYRLQAVAASNGRVYAVGGLDNNPVSNQHVATVEEFDPPTNTWTTKAPMSTPRVDFGLVAIGGKIYAVGGSNGVGVLASVEEYDVAANTWTARAPLPIGRNDLGVAVVNGRIYAVGGHQTFAAGPLRDVDEYDPATNAWTAKAPLPAARDRHAAAAANGRVYAIGGSDPRAVTEYDPVANAWTATTPLPYPLADRSKAVGIGATLFNLGVANFSVTPLVGQLRDRPTVVIPATLADFDRDFKTDLALFTPATGGWYAHRSGGGAPLQTSLGQPGDIPVAGDYDGDGTVDIAIFRPANPSCPGGGSLWFAVQSGGGTRAACLGRDGDVPVPADLDSDARIDLIIVRPSNPGCPSGGALWFALLSDGGTSSFCFGAAGDVPIAVDLDADQRADPIVYRTSTGQFFTRPSFSAATVVRIGSGGEIPVPADYTGDGQADLATYGQDGTWTIVYTPCGGIQFQPQCTYSTRLGAGTSGGDFPVPGDYDSDGRADLAVFAPQTNSWYVSPSDQSAPIQTVLGAGGAVPAAKRPSYPGTYPYDRRAAPATPTSPSASPGPLASPAAPMPPR